MQHPLDDFCFTRAHGACVGGGGVGRASGVRRNLGISTPWRYEHEVSTISPVAQSLVLKGERALRSAQLDLALSKLVSGPPLSNILDPLGPYGCK
jgi:hypothetical protein